MSITCPCCHNINVVFAEMFHPPPAGQAATGLVLPKAGWWMIRTKEPQPIDKCPYCRSRLPDSLPSEQANEVSEEKGLTNAQSEMPRVTESNDTGDEGDTSGVPPSDDVQTDGG